MHIKLGYLENEHRTPTFQNAMCPKESVKAQFELCHNFDFFGVPFTFIL